MAGRMSRRTWIRRGLLGGAVLALGGATVLAGERGKRVPPQAPLKALDPESYSVLSAVAERMVPPAPGFPRPRAIHVVEHVDTVVSRLEDADQRDLTRVLHLLENALPGLLLDGRLVPFTRLDPARQDRVLLGWRDSRLALRRSAYKVIRSLVLAAYYATPATYAAVGYPGPPDVSGMVPAAGATP